MQKLPPGDIWHHARGAEDSAQLPRRIPRRRIIIGQTARDLYYSDMFISLGVKGCWTDLVGECNALLQLGNLETGQLENRATWKQGNWVTGQLGNYVTPQGKVVSIVSIENLFRDIGVRKISANGITHCPNISLSAASGLPTGGH
jgi:hypothetical protein